jgi:hypothetical protein
MNYVIASISFHRQKHAHILAMIDRASSEHPNLTRAKVVRGLIVDGATKHVYEEILDEHVPNWRKEYMELIRKQQGQT